MNPSQLILEQLKAPVSYSAGTYVCNHVMYTILHEVSTKYPEMKAGFIHVPFLPEQNPTTGYIMELDEMVRGIHAVIQRIYPRFTTHVRHVWFYGFGAFW